MSEGIAGIILAGGQSRRMGGGDKALALLAGHPLLDHVVDRLKPQVDALALNVNGDPARFGALALPVVPDTVPDFAGPLAGLLAGLEWAAAETRCKWLLTAAADTPFFPNDLARRLLGAVEGRPDAIAVACCNERRHPTFALWPLALAEPLRHMLVEQGNRRVTAFIDANAHVDVDFEPYRLGDGNALDPFFNINTPQDLTEAERLSRSLG